MNSQKLPASSQLKKSSTTPPPPDISQVTTEIKPSETTNTSASASIIPVKKTYKGFASWDREKVQNAGRKGGNIRKSQLGANGYSELGRRGGIKSALKKKEKKEMEKEKQ